MIQKVRKTLLGFLVLTLCVPMNTVFAEGTNEYSKEDQSISLQDDSQKEEKSENEDLQVPTESVKGENIDERRFSARTGGSIIRVDKGMEFL